MTRYWWHVKAHQGDYVSGPVLDERLRNLMQGLQSSLKYRETCFEAQSVAEMLDTLMSSYIEPNSRSQDSHKIVHSVSGIPITPLILEH